MRMHTYNAETTLAIRHAAGGIFTILWGFLLAEATISSFTLSGSEIPGYGVFWISCLGGVVSSVLLGMGKLSGVRGLQTSAVLAFLGLLFSRVRHDILALVIDALLVGATCFTAEIVGRLVHARAARDH